MPGFLPDTHCMPAAVCAWHEHHVPATEEIERRLSQGETLIVAAPALVEAYAVLTRLPPPYRLSPTDALSLLEVNFIGTTRIVPLDKRAYTALLRRAPHEGIVGEGVQLSVSLVIFHEDRHEEDEMTSVNATPEAL